LTIEHNESDTLKRIFNTHRPAKHNKDYMTNEHGGNNNNAPRSYFVPKGRPNPSGLFIKDDLQFFFFLTARQTKAVPVGVEHH